jgi:hypothetical protein
VTDPRITKLWEVIARHNSLPRHQCDERRLFREYWRELCEELYRDDIELYKQFVGELVRKASLYDPKRWNH